MSRIKLFCIPYSGSSASVYEKWNRYLSKEIEIIPVETAGHGRRIQDPLYPEFEDAIADISAIIAENLQPDEKYAILGHSLGSLIAFETYYRLMEMGVHPPCHMFFTGRKAPQDISAKTQYYLMPEDEFLEIVYYYGGTTKEVMADRELLDLFLPILRADFKLAETYVHAEKSEKIQCDITVVNGIADRSVRGVDMNEWRYYAGKKCSILTAPGDHFFLINNCTYISDIINKTLVNIK